MNNQSRTTDYLSHILAAIERIERHTADVDELGFLNSELIQDAVIRNIEIIGEAANKILRSDAAFTTKHDEIPWQVMYAMRNRLSHGYDKIDFEMVWQTICYDLPKLYTSVKSISS